jgi:hypothetical protein
MFPPNIQTMNHVFNVLYIGALVVGAVSSAGINQRGVTKPFCTRVTLREV